MVLGEKGGYLPLGMGPKLGPWRWAENPLAMILKLSLTPTSDQTYPDRILIKIWWFSFYHFYCHDS